MRLLATSGLLCCALLISQGVMADDAVRLEGNLTQGGLVIGHAPPGSTVTLDGAAVRVGSDGVFILGFGREAAPTAELLVVRADGVIDHRTLEVEQRVYEIQHIDGLPEQMVTPEDPELLKRIADERALIQAAWAHDTPSIDFLGGFIWPVDRAGQRRLWQPAHPQRRTAPAALRRRHGSPGRHAGRSTRRRHRAARRAGPLFYRRDE